LKYDFLRKFVALRSEINSAYIFLLDCYSEMSKNKFNLTLPPVEPDPSPAPSPGESAVSTNSNLAAAINSGKPLTQTNQIVIPMSSVIE